jgi:hypothetical protein
MLPRIPHFHAAILPPEGRLDLVGQMADAQNDFVRARICELVEDIRQEGAPRHHRQPLRPIGDGGPEPCTKPPGENHGRHVGPRVSRIGGHGDA